MDIFEGMAGGAQLQLTRTSGARGRILDRNDRIIAQDDVENYAVRLLTRRYPSNSPDACLDELARVFRLYRPDLERYTRYTGQDNGYTVGTLSPEDLQVLQSGLDRVCLLEYLPQRTRFYFGGSLGAQTIGFVGPIRAEQVAEFPNAAPDALVGQFGVERYWQDALGGQSGASLSIVTPDGLTVREIYARESTSGKDVRLTIDRDLQLRVEEALSDAYNAANWAEFSTGAAVVVLDVKTGEVLAMASYPTVHPDAFRLDTSFDADTIAYYLQRRAIVNHATEEVYAPGSVMKVASMVAAADSREFELLDVVNDTGLYTSPDDGRILTNWIYLEPGRDPNHHGIINLKQALTGSCDVYFWTVGERLNRRDPNLFRTYANRLGLGVRTGIDSMPDVEGNIPDPASTRVRQNRPWGVGDALNVVIGQGDAQVTVLQVARMTAAVADGETLPTLSLVRSVGTVGQAPSYVAQPPAPTLLGVNIDAMRGVQEAMCDVTSDSELGTAQWVFWNFDQTRVQVCGKTGTAQTNQPYPHGWFAAYAGPPGEPEIAIAALSLYSREGSETSAFIVRRVIEAYYNLPYEPWPDFWSLPYEMLPTPGLGEGSPPQGQP
jgi:penicillin-binding protein 2